MKLELKIMAFEKENGTILSGNKNATIVMSKVIIKSMRKNYCILLFYLL